MFGVGDLGLFVDVDDAGATLAQCLQHPDDVVGVGFDAAGEIELSATALRAGHDEQVGKSVTVQAEERLDAFGSPLVPQCSATAAGDHVEGRGRHPLKSSRVDQYVERV